MLHVRNCPTFTPNITKLSPSVAGTYTLHGARRVCLEHIHEIHVNLLFAGYLAYTYLSSSIYTYI